MVVGQQLLDGAEQRGPVAGGVGAQALGWWHVAPLDKWTGGQVTSSLTGLLVSLNGGVACGECGTTLMASLRC
ncbi:hypothetical protein Aiant_75340 [Actinoplanes ianthinogenes]|uniref:Uncharacterized protein n=1 Tax=Actinoplanes ianthinogenes TaxID=122358 RepID=A0ABN6CRS7_9ACTN|nr:hypothetical protein Aiant_75340 [Actinoplanes ianthinogenes]